MTASRSSQGPPRFQMFSVTIRNVRMRMPDYVAADVRRNARGTSRRMTSDSALLRNEANEVAPDCCEAPKAECSCDARAETGEGTAPRQGGAEGSRSRLHGTEGAVQARQTS